MSFKQKFTEKQVIAAIQYNSDFPTAARIAEHMKCSIQTVHNLLATLEVKGCVRSVNHGTESRPAVLWSRTAKAIQNSAI